MCLTDEVEIIGQIPFTEVQRLMQEADLLLLPSIEEGVANVVLEAMTLKTLVLTTNCGGMTEVITDGENGFITPIRDSEFMAAKIIEVANMSEEKKDAVREQALKTISNNHREQKMIEAMSQLYQRISY